MSVSSIPVMCYYNGHIVRTDNDVKYDGNKASIVPLEIPVDCTSSHPPMLLEESLSPYGGYVCIYPPRHLMRMMLHYSVVRVGSS